jgi:hypothetical protein
MVGMVIDDDEPEGISEAEHDRLVSACIAATDTEDATHCVPFAAEYVTYMEDHRCDYAATADVIDWLMRNPRAVNDVTRDRHVEQAAEACAGPSEAE